MARTKLDLPQLQNLEMHEDWISVKTLSIKTGWTTDVIYKWIKNKKIEARLFHNLVLVRNPNNQMELFKGVKP